MTQDDHIHLSQDGSHTLYSNKYNAHYHSVYGALDESIHVFITAGLYKLVRSGYKHIRVFEMGLGSGLNALLTMLEAEKYGISVSYHCIESDPINRATVNKLNYSEILCCNTAYLNAIHDTPADTESFITPHFSLIKHIGSIEDFMFDHHYDLVYWDAFAPECQAQLWQKPVHQKIYTALDAQGILVTYCTKGIFKRVLRDLGYHLENLVGPGKKREMLRATKYK